jgi:hypothetical protein
VARPADVATPSGSPRPARKSSSSTTLQRDAGLQQAPCVTGVLLAEFVDAKARSVELLDHDVAFAARHADHGMAEIERHLAAQGAGRRLQGDDIDGFRVEQQTVHVEKNGLDRFPQHAFVLSSVRETANDKHGREKFHAHP